MSIQVQSQPIAGDALSVIIADAYQDLFPEVPAQILRRPEIHLASGEKGRQIFFHADQVEEAGCPAVLELHEHIDVADRGEVIAQDGAEESQPPDIVLSAEPGDRLHRRRKIYGHELGELEANSYLRRFLRERSADEIYAAFDAAMDRVAERRTPEWDRI